MKLTKMRPVTDDPETWSNEAYIAVIRRDAYQRVICLAIRRKDGQQIDNWRAKWHIKNDILGPEAEAIELYPAKSRMIDMSNTYWLWAFPNGEMLPYGFDIQEAYAKLARNMKTMTLHLQALARVLRDE